MNRSTLNVGLSNLKKWKEEKNALRYDLSFQRHIGMWSLPAKSMLVWSILSDSYIPPVVFEKLPGLNSEKSYSFTPKFAPVAL